MAIMDSADKLIEYYFQRKIAGMPSAEILQSLEHQMLEEEEREIIVSQVEYKESLYLKALNQKKNAQILGAAGIVLLLISTSFLIYTFVSKNQFINPIIVYLVMGCGAATTISSLALFPRKNLAIKR